MTDVTTDDVTIKETNKTIRAGNEYYQTDIILVELPDGEEKEANHFQRKCINCNAIAELAIDWPAMFCPFCDYSKVIHDDDLASIIFIEDKEPN